MSSELQILWPNWKEFCRPLGCVFVLAQGGNSDAMAKHTFRESKNGRLPVFRARFLAGVSDIFSRG